MIFSKQEDKINRIIKDIEEEEKRINPALSRIKRIEEMKEKMKRYSGDDEVVTFEDIAHLKEEDTGTKIYSGYKKLDDMLTGFREGQVVTITAATGQGKTSFCLELTIRLKDYNPLWFSFEDSAPELVDKFVSIGEKPPYALTPKYITNKQVDWIEQRIVEAIGKYGTKVVFIDHLHHIVPMISNHRYDLLVGNTIRRIREIAQKWDVCIFLVAHIKHIDIQNMPKISDIRDASFIGQESDSVIVIWRVVEEDNDGGINITDKTKISVQKNRKGGKLGSFYLMFKNNRYFEIDYVHNTEQN